MIESNDINLNLMESNEKHCGTNDTIDNLLKKGRNKRCRNRGSNKSLLLVLVVLLLTFLNNKCMVNADDDMFDDESHADMEDDDGTNFESVSLMPVSCINYNNGHMIKFQLFDNESNYKCHQKSMGTFVVSVAHYMRAYFNYQALIQGRNFALPSDVGYLNCVALQATAYANVRLYAKVGCMTRETFTSTKLQLHLYKDNQCTYPYRDGNTDHYHSTKGYDVNGYLLSTKVDFRPAFYSCQNCKPDQISSSFNKKNYWYDDDYINAQKQNQKNNDDGGEDDGEDEGDDGNVDDGDDYNDHYQTNYFDDAFNYTTVDDAYFTANDDGAVKADDDYYSYRDDDAYVNYADDGGYANGDDEYYGYDDAAANDDANGRRLEAMPFHLYASDSDLKSYENDFWKEVEEQRRSLSDVQEWNMCSRIYKYGMWCDEDCRALDTFRVNQWSHSDIFLLIIMCGFMSAMMLLIFAKRVKAYEKANVYGDEYETNYPGLPPMAMLLLFILIMTIILFLANLKFVNETLVFSVVVCVLLFIYMLKLTLFETRGPHLLPPANRVPMNSMNGQLFN